MKAWRIAHSAFPLMDGEGSASNPGRWNGPRQRAIYCGASFAIAMLERLCYTGLGRVPTIDVYIEIDVPDDLLENFDPTVHPGWERAGSAAAKSFGAKWLADARSAALLVPSVVTRIDCNVVLNPEHPSFFEISWTAPRQVIWDRRLFNR